MAKAPGRRPLDEIAERLRWTREALGVNQAEIARRAKLSPQQWNNYEKGRQRIALDEALKLCTATGVTLDWIYRGDLGGVAMELGMRIQDAAGKPAPSKRRA